MSEGKIKIKINKNLMSAIVIFDIDGVIRDVTNSYRRALADTVEHFTNNHYRPSMEDIDSLKAEGIWNNDWLGSQELIYRYFEQMGKSRDEINLNYEEIVDFFQRRYRGQNLEQPTSWDGYISSEPLLVSREYFEILDKNNLYWGFFSGATNGSAQYILQRRLGLENPVLVAMDDAPSKPDPTGLFLAVNLLEEKLSLDNSLPVIYLGDTVADIITVMKAKEIKPEREWIAVGVLPPHVSNDNEKGDKYRQQLIDSGASFVVNQITDFYDF